MQNSNPFVVKFAASLIAVLGAVIRLSHQQALQGCR